MPTLNELVDIGIGRQVHKALADSNNAADFDTKLQSLLEAHPGITRNTFVSVPSGRGWFHDQYMQAKENKPAQPKPSEVPTYPASQPRKMRIKP